MGKHFRSSRLSRIAVVLGIGLGTISLPVLALELAGLNIAAQTVAGNTVLQLNGAGVRRDASLNMYTAALYLEEKLSSADVIIKGSGAKQFNVVFLRDVNGREIGELLVRGLVANSSDDELANLIPEIFELGKLTAEHGKLYAGDGFQIDWSPTGGTTISVRERGQTIPAVQISNKPDLIAAMMRIWLGSQPADLELKKALLGS